jgi:hypothetical protein
VLLFNEAVSILKEIQKKIDIPNDANFQFVEKRNIEITTEESISPMGVFEKNTRQVVESETLAGNNLQDLPTISELVVWIGYFSKGPFFWELAIDMNGTLVRLRKSR